MKNNQQTKIKIIEALFQRPEFTKQVNGVEYRTRCPFCGDSLNENTGHLYLRIDPNDNLPIVYHCFRCEESGILQGSTLSLMDIENVNLKSELDGLNKTSDKFDNKNLSGEKENLFFDYQIPSIEKEDKKIKYIEKRLGVEIPEEDYSKLKIISSLYSFLSLNHITTSAFKIPMMDIIEKKYVGLLSYGNSHILFRDITDQSEYRWIKYPITPDSINNRLFYTIGGSLGLFTKETITVNLTEGVMDILSVYYNLGYDKDNIMNIAVSGKYFDKIILYLVDLGIVGSNIIINIFADNDAVFGKKNVKANFSSSLAYYRKTFHIYKYLFKEINVYYNSIGKDVGVPREEISLIHNKI